MHEVGLNVEGMYCDHCSSVVSKALQAVDGVRSVRMDGNVAWISFSGAPRAALASACAAVRAAGYDADPGKTIKPQESTAPARLKAVGTFALIVAAFVVAARALEALAGYNVFNAIPAIDSSMTYGALFATGLLTGLHCLSMCGALNLAAATSGRADTAAAKPKPSLSPIAYNLGRLLSYTALGALAGAIGGVVGISKEASTALILAAGALMMAMALRMAGIVKFSVKLPKIPAFERLSARNRRSGTPFVIGLVNGLMPCGPLQAMQLYAIGTGDAAVGALSMFLFCLGTIPFMLAIGYAASALGGRSKAVIAKVAAAFMFTLAASMVGRGLAYAGIDATELLPSGNVLQAREADGLQLAEFDLNYDNYANISVKKGVPVQMVVNADEGKLTGCNNEIVIEEWGIDQKLAPGRNVIEFTPTETGTYTYSCWMRMITNTIEVTD
ncbi:MAG: hypothetical protein E7Z99_03510 [Coriobacteriaceae bacterium]|nr:hypothetical protein [Coriobacteriaceae bacterium]